ncbi:MAG TPA: diguanylate cyclase [Gemmatimonadaceae bacterium]|nr:diguanylate cyclase [Gemmatimonadaceae bacterium]
MRGKLTLALLVTGLASAAVVGLVARTVVSRRFDRLMLESSFQMFEGDVVAYVQKYGSWQAGEAHENFHAFSSARHRPDAPGASPAGDPDANAFMVATPNGPTPPFRFLLLDRNDGQVLMGPDEYRQGKPVTDALRADARPIVVNGQVAALAIPLRTPNYNAFDDSYLAAMQNAVLYGLGTAALLALGLGFFFGERLSRHVRALTDAIGAMARGELRQRVEVRTNDEVGLMAAMFNDMSADLAESHTRIRAQAALLKELSIHDDLTGLHNRRHFDEQAVNAYARARRYGQPLTVMICDVDHFKTVNDTYSHAVGDAVLAQLGRLLRVSMRDSDLVARYGGEEFVVIFPETRVDQAATLCERVRERIEAHDWSAIRPGLRITLSVGLDGDLARGSVDAMLAAADARMYEAKSAGRNRVVAGASGGGRIRLA